MRVAFQDCDARKLSSYDNSYIDTCYRYLHCGDIDGLIFYVSYVLQRRCGDGHYVYRLTGDRLACDDITDYICSLARRLSRRRITDSAIVARLAFIYGLR